jgi:hypothetical protein
MQQIFFFPQTKYADMIDLLYGCGMKPCTGIR